MSLHIDYDKFRAMGCAVQVRVLGASAAHTGSALRTARRSIHELERLWSRFLPTSDISRLNGAHGAPVAVDPATIGLLEAMVAGVAATDGCFDPTLLAPLVALGYDASWSDQRCTTSLPTGVAWRGSVAQIGIDREASVAQLPVATVLDAGGIGKGLAADLVVAELLKYGSSGAMVSIGGDLRVAGVGPNDGGWLVGVVDETDRDHHGTDAVAQTQLSLLNAGVATSGVRRRAWKSRGTNVHHLLDPSTGRPTSGQIVQATVVAGSAAWAEVYTKSLMVRGEKALEPLDDAGVWARVLLADGSIQCNQQWQTNKMEYSCIRN